MLDALPCRVLLVEDDAGDARLVELFLLAESWPCDITWVVNVAEA